MERILFCNSARTFSVSTASPFPANSGNAVSELDSVSGVSEFSSSLLVFQLSFLILCIMCALLLNDFSVFSLEGWGWLFWHFFAFFDLACFLDFLPPPVLVVLVFLLLLVCSPLQLAPSELVTSLSETLDDKVKESEVRCLKLCVISVLLVSSANVRVPELSFDTNSSVVLSFVGT